MIGAPAMKLAKLAMPTAASAALPLSRTMLVSTKFMTVCESRPSVIGTAIARMFASRGRSIIESPRCRPGLRSGQRESGMVGSLHWRLARIAPAVHG
jgi:hypothetical protein